MYVYMESLLPLPYFPKYQPYAPFRPPAWAEDQNNLWAFASPSKSSQGRRGSGEVSSRHQVETGYLIQDHLSYC